MKEVFVPLEEYNGDMIRIDRFIEIVRYRR